MHGWVIVYLPGGDVYQMLSGPGPRKTSLLKRLLRGSLSTAVTFAQLYYWLKSSGHLY